ncbi:MAG: glycosyltransferase family 9 protein [Candidatus Tyrphobacter sp.]
MPQSSPSALIIRLDGIGDALSLTPLLAALHANAVPADLVLCERNAGVFSSAAARCVEIAPFELRSSTTENLTRLSAFGDRLKERAYSDVLVATEDPGGYRLARAIGAPRSVGFTNGLTKPLKTLWARSLLTDTLHRPTERALPRHECETLFDLGAGLVREAEPTRDLARLRALVYSEAVRKDGRVAFQVTQKWERFGVTPTEVAACLRQLAGDFSLHAISSLDESGFADAIERASGVGVERYADVSEWKRAIASAIALVAPDSGATHVAGMLGTPTVALFPQGPHVDREIARWRPWAAPYRTVTIADGWQQHTGSKLRRLLSLDRA